MPKNKPRAKRAKKRSPQAKPTSTLAKTSSKNLLKAKLIEPSHDNESSAESVLERVIGGALQPHERALSELHAATSSEAEGYAHCITCDQCQLRSPGARTKMDACTRAHFLGWLVSDDGDFCPAHRGDPLALPGSAPEPLAPLDKTFLDRLLWLCEKFSSGTTPEACFRNSVGSGRRSMLEDFAERVSFDIEKLELRVQEICARGGYLDDVCVQERATNWKNISELFALCQKYPLF